MGPMRRRAGTAAAAVLALALTGCGSASEHYDATGIDELVIPTPSPAPSDFVTGIDNPWLALDAGTEATYGAQEATTRVTFKETVEDGPTVAGVATTAVVSTMTRANPSDDVLALTQHTDYVAQDARGDVWWFGREGEWQAGADGAEAGLLMAAHPRIGDGYRTAPGLTARVVGVDATVDNAIGDYDHVVVVDTTDDEGRVERAWYASDSGLVRQETTAGTPAVVLELVARAG